jgi:hypothetical protein
MIRHTFCGRLAHPVSTLPVAMIEAAFLRLLMPALGGAALEAASRFATSGRAIDLAPITTRADKELTPTAWSAAKALAEKKRNLSEHRSTR